MATTVIGRLSFAAIVCWPLLVVSIAALEGLATGRHAVFGEGDGYAVVAIANLTAAWFGIAFVAVKRSSATERGRIVVRAAAAAALATSLPIALLAVARFSFPSGRENLPPFGEVTGIDYARWGFGYEDRRRHLSPAADRAILGLLQRSGATWARNGSDELNDPGWTSELELFGPRRVPVARIGIFGDLIRVAYPRRPTAYVRWSGFGPNTGEAIRAIAEGA